MKQERLDKHTSPQPVITPVKQASPRHRASPRMIDIDLGDFKAHPLWGILVETTMRSPLYPGLSGIVREKILPESPNISPKELASMLSISVGEALVLLDAARPEI